MNEFALKGIYRGGILPADNYTKLILETIDRMHNLILKIN
jgi:hypothetical protein